ncbi:hypothetical protein [Paenibacillus sp. YPG26]|uniref:hypothetical protein n=1 Tax=Paenibacillus sp. YPG26 TaxID=2878915 RepID=UPI00203FFA98|nr:hypothetical protein [Paenibacillus sp. YPG26]USB34909.1 hypothetical protein LDO05_09225 [Paenibacillus sp. YPG26]
MTETTKKLLWLSAGLALWITALVYGWAGVSLSSQALDHASAIAESQNRSITKSSNMDSVETYTGAQVLVLMQDRHKENPDVNVEFEGRLYPVQAEAGGDFPSSEISVTSTYKVEYGRDSTGKLEQISFTKLN